MDGLGLGYAHSRRRSRLIYLAATGFGNDGPGTRSWPGSTSSPKRVGADEHHRRARRAAGQVGVPIADLSCALYATIAVLAALRAATVTDMVSSSTFSLLESAVRSALEAGRYFATGDVPPPSGPPIRPIAPYQAVRSPTGTSPSAANTHCTGCATCAALDPRRARLGRALRDQRAATGEPSRR